MKELEFKFEENVMRTITDDLKETWFVGIDVCNVLGYSDAHQKIKSLDPDEYKLDRIRDGQGKLKDTLTVNEFGLYSLILSSTKSSAKKFKKWITHEVLPSIRRTGTYTTDQVKNKQIRLQELRQLKDAKMEAISEAKLNTKKLEGELKKLETEFWEVFDTDPNQLKIFSDEQMEEAKG